MAGGTPDTDTEAELFVGVRPDLSFDDALPLVREWRPDLIVGDSYDYLGPLLAARLDVPFGTVTLGPEFRPDQTVALQSKVDLRAERGLGLRKPVFVADICPPVMQVDHWQRPEHWLPLRPESHRAPNGPEPKSSSPVDGERPRVLITFGTLFGSPKVLNPLINEVAALDADLRVTLGPAATPEEFDVDRERVQFEPFRPMAELLSDCDVVVCHGGAGTTLGALSLGIPLVVLPYAADQFAVADRVVVSGAGLRLLPEEAAVESRIRQAVTELLTDSAFRDRAAKVAAQIAGMPTAAEVVESIAEILG